MELQETVCSLERAKEIDKEDEGKSNEFGKENTKDESEERKGIGLSNNTVTEKRGINYASPPSGCTIAGVLNRRPAESNTAQE